MNDKPQPSLARARVFGAMLLPASLIMAYYTMWKPLHEAQQTGVLHYYIKGILLPPMLLYAGVCILLADLRDGQIRTTGPDGKPKLTSKGWSFVVGMMVVMALTFTAWYLYLRAVGFSAF